MRFEISETFNLKLNFRSCRVLRPRSIIAARATTFNALSSRYGTSRLLSLIVSQRSCHQVFAAIPGRSKNDLLFGPNRVIITVYSRWVSGASIGALVEDWLKANPIRGGNLNLKRAFTLIELLVVIAIIAILAAILFPVFAQAKLQAKKAASLSNVKEVGLANLMYENDADDYFVLSSNADASQGGLITQISNPVNGTKYHADTWVYLVQPYIKNFGIMVDPAMGDLGSAELGANASRRNQDLFPGYAYNYLFLSPWYNCQNSLSRSETAGVHPASTVMFTTGENYGSSRNTSGWYAANAPGAWPIVAPAPFACIWYGYWNGSATAWTGNWSVTNPTGVHYSSSTRAVQPYGGANVVWVDGHAKYLNDGALAAGTDYGTSTSGNASSGATILNQNNPVNYLWTLDGTLNDLSF